MDKQNLLEVKDLHITFKTGSGPLRAVRGMNLSLARGESVGIVGESGSGKSMTALALMRLLPNNAEMKAASLRFDNQDLLATTDKYFAESIAGQKIAMIFQEPMTSLNPVYTIERQMTEGMIRAGKSAKEAKARALYLLERVKMPDPEHKLYSYPHQLSGGQRQRVMIAMALMNDPILMIADEPTTALDVTVQAEILALLKELQQELGMALILITHDLAVVSNTVDKVVVLYAGEPLEQGTTQQVLVDTKHPYTQGLMQCVPVLGKKQERLGAIPGIVPSLLGHWEGCIFAPRCARAIDACHQGVIPFAEQGEAHWVRCNHIGALPQPEVSTIAALERPATQAEHPLIEVRDITRIFSIKKGFFNAAKELRAVDQANLTIQANEVVAIVGESGSGKSTLARIILGLDSPNAGQIFVQGQEISKIPEIERAKLIQPIFQDPYSSLNPRRTVGEIIGRPLEVHQIGSAQSRKDRVEEMLGKVGLPARVINNYPSQMSGGQRQRVAIARALMLNPQLLVCDEPTSALDVSVQAQILNLLHDLKTSLGLSMLFITHDIGVVQQVADRVIVMNKGKIVEQGEVNQILHHPQDSYTAALLGSVPVLNQLESV